MKIAHLIVLMNQRMQTSMKMTILKIIDNSNVINAFELNTPFIILTSLQIECLDEKV